MRETYQVCVKCKTLNALLTYFLSKEEKLTLSAYEKGMCWLCYEKYKKRKINNEIYTKPKQTRLDF